MKDPLVVAERVVALRAQLREAEEEFQKLVGGARSARPGKVTRAPREDSAPVAARARELLQTAGRPLSFSEIHQALGDVKREAIKSALKKARDGGTVGFKQFKYFWR